MHDFLANNTVFHPIWDPPSTKDSDKKQVLKYIDYSSLNTRFTNRTTNDLLSKATFVLFSSAAIHDRKETMPRETTTEKISANPYWCFSMGVRVVCGFPEENWKLEKEKQGKGLELTQGIGKKCVVFLRFLGFLPQWWLEFSSQDVFHCFEGEISIPFLLPSCSDQTDNLGL